VRGITAVALPDATATTLGLLAADGVVIGGAGTMIVLAAVAHAGDPRTALLAGGLATCAVAAVLAGSARAYAADVATTAAGVARRTAALAGAGAGRTAALEVDDLNFSYGRRQVLFGVNLRVGEGEIAALLGANGAGKSTLLRLVAGLDHPSSGSIAVFGRDTTYAEAEQQVAGGVAMLAGGRMSFPGLTVGENLRIAAFTFRRDRARLASAIDEVTQLFPVLGERLDQRVGTLSGGEQQMLALGRVLLTRPRLLLIDELSLGLAPRVVEALLDIIRRVNQQGTTVLLVEQSANLALGIARHAFFLERGQVRFDGATSDLMARDDLLRPVFLTRPA
jgi:ABC-type branched-subunit amino acid transport system ATPase component